MGALVSASEKETFLVEFIIGWPLKNDAFERKNLSSDRILLLLGIIRSQFSVGDTIFPRACWADLVTIEQKLPCDFFIAEIFPSIEATWRAGAWPLEEKRSIEAFTSEQIAWRRSGGHRKTKFAVSVKNPRYLKHWVGTTVDFPQFMRQPASWKTRVATFVL